MTGKAIYIASKTKHRAKWIALREAGHNIISTWMYAEGDIDRDVLCFRCKHECLKCDGLILYAEDGDVLHDALIEAGIVLASGLKPVYAVGDGIKRNSLFQYSHQMFHASSVVEAIKLINENK